jgi:hypothetical protein
MAAVRYIVSGRSNKITLIIVITINMTQTANDTRHIISIVFLDIGCTLRELELKPCFDSSKLKSGSWTNNYIIMWSRNIRYYKLPSIRYTHFFARK